MKVYSSQLIVVTSLAVLFISGLAFSFPPGASLIIKKTADFAITGDGSRENWKKTEWTSLPLHDSTKGVTYSTKVKVLYSATGLYFLYHNEDERLNATLQGDFLDLWNEDVVEVFIQPNDKTNLYLEYELSPLDYELPIMIYNRGEKLNSWMPFHYEGDRKTRHATSIKGGDKKSLASVTGWSAEFFIPYTLLEPFMQALPKAGTKWKGNIYRIDYEEGQTLWSWQKTSGSFHEYKKFGTFLFE